MSKLSDLTALCRGRPVYIQTHNFPDPDAIASAFGLQRLLAARGVESRLCYDGRIDKLSASKMLSTFHLDMSSYESLRGQMRETDPIICVDTQKHAGNVTDLIGDEIACIDHHPTFVPMEYKYRDIRITGACASLIAEYYAQSETVPDRDVATALLYGIKMDTLNLTRGVTALDVDMLGFLFPYCDPDTLADLERNNMEFSDLKAYGAAIENIELYDNIGISCVPFSCPDAMVAILSDFILALIEVEVAIVASFREDGIKLSVRSETPDVHAGDLLHRALADIGSGGGHASMGGGFIGKEQVPELGNYPRERIRDLFLSALPERQTRGPHPQRCT